jgi:response regulator RpfG family c-di-GMP phosphodiesterase
MGETRVSDRTWDADEKGDRLAGLPVVLVVDDDADVLESLVELLRRDYRVMSTTDPDEALAMLEQNREVALLLTDQRMPDMTGVELLAAAAELSPETVRMLFTGYTDISAVIAAINDGRVFRYITKPWDPEELLANVGAAVRTFAISKENLRLTAELQRAVDEALSERERAERLQLEEQDLSHRNDTLGRALEDLRTSHWHLRRLQELLPICTYCGKVRTGDDYWQSVEAYLAENSDFLTHGICPECLARLNQELEESHE